MAVDYADLFADLGKLVKHVNLLGTEAANLATDRAEIETQFESTAQQDKIKNLRAQFDSLRNGHFNLRSQLATIAQNRLRDRTTIVNELELQKDDLATVMDALILNMVASAEDIDASVVTIGSVTAGGANVGNGTVLIDKVLDGVTRPGQGMFAHPSMNGVASQLAVSETVTVTVIRDSYGSGGVTEGFEQLGIKGEVVGPGGLWVDPEGGSGPGPSFRTANANTLLTGRDMESFVSNLPTGWTLYLGTAGTHIAQTTTAGQFYRGASALKLIGDGAQGGMGVYQQPPLSRLVPLKRYCVTFRYKASATDTATQHLTVQFEGTGYTAASSEKVDVTGDNWPTSWTLGSFYINLPAVLPSDFQLVVKLTGTPAAGKTMYIDDVCLTEVVWHGGLNFVAVAGATPFVEADKFTSAIANDQEGVFQEFFRRAMGRQLPSQTDTSETRADSLAS